MTTVLPRVLPNARVEIMRFKYTFVLKCMLLVLFIPWLGIYYLNLVWGGYLFATVMFDTGISLNVSDHVLDGEMARAGGTHSRIAVSAFFVFYFGFIGVLRLRNEINCLSSITGAKKDHCSGVIFE